MIPSVSLAHPGNTDSSGCHTCRTNCPSWGLSYGEYHCHNSRVPQPVYVEPWSCTIKGQKFYSSSSAQSKWREMVHSAVDDVYSKLLERSSNQNDYNYWESKIPYNNCNFYVEPKKIWDEVLNSDERKALLAKKEEETRKKAEEASAKVKANNNNTGNQQTSNKNCYIATAVYGSEDDKKVQELRNFRDQYLLKSEIGKDFVNLYYQTSPPIANYISDKFLLREAIKEFQIDPLVWLIDRFIMK